MGLLKAALAALLGIYLFGGCYDPSLRDCAVTCANEGDCADGQVCGSDKFCSAPEVAGTCGSGSGSNVTMVSLHVMVTGHGSVVIDNLGTCATQGSQNGNCTWMVPMAVALQMHAVMTDGGHAFFHWAMPATCAVNTDCSVTPTMPMTMVVANFF